MQERARWKRRGQGLTEYMIVLALIAVASIFIIAKLGKNTRATLGNANAALVGKGRQTDLLETKKGETDQRGLDDFYKNR